MEGTGLNVDFGAAPPSMASGSTADIRWLLGARTPAAKQAALRRASQELEAVFLRQMISAMRKTVGEGGLLKKSNGEKMFEGMLDDQWARELAQHGGTSSLGELLYRQLSARMGMDEPGKGSAAFSAEPSEAGRRSTLAVRAVRAVAKGGGKGNAR